MDNSHKLNLLEAQGLQLSSIMNELDEYFPVVTPTPDTELNTIMYRAGQRSVVEWLQQRLEE